MGKVVIVRATGRVEGTAKGGIVKGGRVVVGAGVGVEVFWGGWDGIWGVGGIEKGVWDVGLGYVALVRQRRKSAERLSRTTLAFLSQTY